MTDEMPPGWDNPGPPGPSGQPDRPLAGGQNPEPAGTSGQPGYGQHGYPPPGYPPPGGASQPGHGQPGYPPPGYPPPGSAGQPGYGQPGYGQPGYGQHGYGQAGPGGWYAAPAPGGVPLRPLSLGDIFNGTVTLARRNPAATFGLTAIVMTGYGVVAALLQRLYTGRLNSIEHTLQAGQNLSQHQVDQVFGSLLRVALPAIAATLVLALVVDAALTGLLSTVIGRGLLGRKIGLSEAWQASRPSAVLAGSVLLLLLGICVPLPVAVVVVVLIALHLTPVAVALAVLCGIAAIIIEVLLVIRLSVTLPAVVLERISPVAAIRRSWELTAGSFWRLFGILVLTGIVVGVASQVLAIPFLLIAGAMSGSSGLLAASASTSVAALIVSAVGSIVAATVTRPVSAGVSVLLYTDLRMRREGFDVTLRNTAQNQALTGDESAAVWLPRSSGAVPPRAW